jgi:hypothetical protein
MHYKNGREAKNGDRVVMVRPSGTPIAGILYDAVVGNDSCDGKIAVAYQNDAYACLSDCLHAEDVAAAFANPPKPARALIVGTDGVTDGGRPKAV